MTLMNIHYDDWYTPDVFDIRANSQYKKQLSLKDWKDGNEYNDAKDSFIKTEEAKAILWYRKNNQALFS